jgi:hypothetical protein
MLMGVCAALLAGSAPVAATSCASPQLLVAEPVVAPGTTVIVSGWGFATCPESGDAEPLTGVELLVRVDDAEKAIGVIDFGPDADVVLDLHIPPSLGTGDGTIVARWIGRQGILAEAAAPITVAGSPGDTGDRPFFEIEARDSSSPEWLWLGLATLLGVALGVGLSALRRRRAS